MDFIRILKSYFQQVSYPSIAFKNSSELLPQSNPSTSKILQSPAEFFVGTITDTSPPLMRAPRDRFCFSGSFLFTLLSPFQVSGLALADMSLMRPIIIVLRGRRAVSWGHTFHLVTT
jgi:hypothetical protein